MWSLDYTERLYWAEGSHLEALFSLSFQISFVVSPIKFDLGNDIYLMVAYIEYIWLKGNNSKSHLTKIVRLL